MVNITCNVPGCFAYSFVVVYITAFSRKVYSLLAVYTLLHFVTNLCICSIVSRVWYSRTRKIMLYVQYLFTDVVKDMLTTACVYYIYVIIEFVVTAFTYHMHVMYVIPHKMCTLRDMEFNINIVYKQKLVELRLLKFVCFFMELHPYRKGVLLYVVCWCTCIQ